jgi:hypothetical protein
MISRDGHCGLRGFMPLADEKPLQKKGPCHFRTESKKTRKVRTDTIASTTIAGPVSMLFGEDDHQTTHDQSIDDI